MPSASAIMAISLPLAQRLVGKTGRGDIGTAYLALLIEHSAYIAHYPAILGPLYGAALEQASVVFLGESGPVLGSHPK